MIKFATVRHDQSTGLALEADFRYVKLTSILNSEGDIVWNIFEVFTISCPCKQSAKVFTKGVEYSQGVLFKG